MGIDREISKSSGRIRRKKIFRFFSFGALLASALFALTNYVFHVDQFYIKQIYISGNKQVEDGRIFAVVSDILSGKYYGMYPKSNFLIYPKELIISSLLRGIPLVASAEVSGSMNSLYVNILEREPKYLWCDDLSKPIIDRTCYYLDKNGFAFNKAPNFSDHVYLEFYGGDKRGGYMGRSVLPPDELRAVVNIENSAETILKNQSYLFGSIYGVNILNDGDYDLILSNGKNDWKINFDLSTDVPKKLEAILASPFFTKELSSSGKRLEYIDLRFGKKVFYKFDSL